MTNEEAAMGGGRRSPRQGVGGSPVGSWLTIALAVIALVLGFLILNNITGDDSSGGSLPDSSGQDDGGLDTIPDITVDVPETTPPSSTTPPRVTTGASVLVANGNSVGGSAGDMSKSLELAGYTVVDPPVDSNDSVDDSIVYFDPAQAAAEAVAESVATDLGGVEVLELDTPAPTQSGDIGDAGVLVLLGENEAGKSLEEIAAENEGAIEAPDPSDGATPSTDAG